MKKMFASVAVLFFAVSLSFGQGSDQPASSRDGNSAAAPAVGPNYDSNRDHNNWGWVGLLGLAGLGGLAGRKRDVSNRDRGDVSNIRRAA
jgi:MYXO-CTERM domain-containing protein